jgi:hypothetical protein
MVGSGILRRPWSPPHRSCRLQDIVTRPTTWRIVVGLEDRFSTAQLQDLLIRIIFPLLIHLIEYPNCLRRATPLPAENMALNRVAIVGLVALAVGILFPVASVIILIRVRATRIWALLIALELAPMVIAIGLLLGVRVLRERMKELFESAKHLPRNQEKFGELPLSEQIVGVLIAPSVFSGIVPSVFLFAALFRLDHLKLQQKVAIPIATWYGYNLFLAYAFANHHHYAVSLVLSSYLALTAFHSNVGMVGTHKGVLRVHSFTLGPQPPSAVLILELVFAGAFAAIHYNVSLIDHAAYSGMIDWQDSIYFSIVTLATVGYGDIVPLSHVAALVMFD